MAVAATSPCLPTGGDSEDAEADPQLAPIPRAAVTAAHTDGPAGPDGAPTLPPLSPLPTADLTSRRLSETGLVIQTTEPSLASVASVAASLPPVAAAPPAVLPPVVERPTPVDSDGVDSGDAIQPHPAASALAAADATAVEDAAAAAAPGESDTGIEPDGFGLSSLRPDPLLTPGGYEVIEVTLLDDDALMDDRQRLTKQFLGSLCSPSGIVQPPRSADGHGSEHPESPALQAGGDRDGPAALGFGSSGLLHSSANTNGGVGSASGGAGGYSSGGLGGLVTSAGGHGTSCGGGGGNNGGNPPTVAFDVDGSIDGHADGGGGGGDRGGGRGVHETPSLASGPSQAGLPSRGYGYGYGYGSDGAALVLNRGFHAVHWNQRPSEETPDSPMALVDAAGNPVPHENSRHYLVASGGSMLMVSSIRGSYQGPRRMNSRRARAHGATVLTPFHDMEKSALQRFSIGLGGLTTAFDAAVKRKRPVAASFTHLLTPSEALGLSGYPPMADEYLQITLFSGPNPQLLRHSASGGTVATTTPWTKRSILPGEYNPVVLDDPEVKMERNKTVIALPGLTSSIIVFSKPSHIRKEMNEQFRVEHPELDPDITLTKIRKMKSCILLIARSTGMDLSTVAYAYAYFEKLVVKRVVTKANRRVIAATCLLLAAKINEPRELNYRKINSAAGKIMDISPKEIAKNEFSIYTSLSFSLFLGPWQVMPHLERIQAATLSQQR